MATLTITILADAAKAKKALQDTGDDLENLGSRTAGLGTMVAAGAAAGVAGLVALGKGAWEAAEESAKVGRETERVISTTGAAAWTSASQVNELSQAISDKTGVDDEAVQSGANLLLTFTNVRNELGAGNDVFDQAVGLTQDMATALGTDASGAAIQLGKALNDPVRGITALSRAGVSFTEQQKEQIKAMVAAGDLLGAQRVILAELSKEFGGAAEAAGTPLDKLMVKLGNLQEDIGAKLIPAVQTGAQFVGDTMGPAFEKATGFVTEHETALRSLAYVGLAGVAAAIAPVVAGYATMAATTVVAKVTELTGALTYMKGAFLEVAASQGVLSASTQVAGYALSSVAGRATIVAAAIMAITNVSDEGSAAATKFADSVAAPVGDMQAAGAAADRLKNHIRELVESEKNQSFGDQLAAIADVVIPFHDVANSMHDVDAEANRGIEIHKQWEEQQRASAAAMENLSVKLLGGKDAAAAMGAQGGVLRAQLEGIAKSEKIDPASTEGAARLQALYEKTQFARVGVLNMTEAQEKFTAATSTAKDKVDAFKSSLDALVGVHLSAAEAETKLSQNSWALTKTLVDNQRAAAGATDVATASSLAQINAINANNSAIQGNVSQILSHAEAVYRETGSLDTASAALATNRQHLIDTMVQTGYTEEAARAYIDRLGLTPANINTQVNLDNNDARWKLEWIDGKFVRVEQGAHGVVTVDTTQAQAALDQFYARNPTFVGPISGKEAIDWVNKHRAAGGPVLRNTAYVVGESGPELFVPKSSGFIVPNGSTIGTGATVNITVNTTGLGADSPEIARQVVSAIRRYERNNGRV